MHIKDNLLYGPSRMVRMFGENLIIHLLNDIHFTPDLVKVILKEMLFPLITSLIMQIDALFTTVRPTLH